MPNSHISLLQRALAALPGSQSINTLVRPLSPIVEEASCRHGASRICTAASGLLQRLGTGGQQSAPTATLPGGPGVPQGVASLRSLHTSSPVADSDRSAAVRRLAVAKARRERAAGGSSLATSRGSDLERADALAASEQLQQQQQPQQGALVVTPTEGKASEVQLASALDHPALIVTRPVEWGQVIFGYEQAQRYTVYDETGTLVALVAEDFGGLGKEVGRQLLRSRRSFTATVFSADGSQVLFRLRRPAYLINSSMFVEDGEGNVVGEIQQRWHALRRNYDLYINKSQFAAISGTFLAWEFELKDAAGGTLALVDRNFQGFGKEIFTDAGKYVIHFGASSNGQQQEPQQQQLLTGQEQQQQQTTAASPPTLQQPAVAAAAAAAAAPGVAAAPSPASAPPPVTPMAMARTDVATIPTVSGNQLVVSRPLALTERMVALACALTIDYDYFSQHSHGGGGIVPPLIIGGTAPTPVPAPGDGGAPGGGGPGGSGRAAEDMAGAGAAGAASGATSEAMGEGGGAGEAAGSYGGQYGGQQGSGDWGGASFSGEGGFDGGQQWGSGEAGDGEMKWDLPTPDAEGLGGEEGGGGVVKGVLGVLWGLFGSD